VRKRLVCGIASLALGALFAVGCGGGGAAVDANKPPIHADAYVPPVSIVDGGICQGSTAKEISDCIINGPGPGGTVITRLKPVDYQTCR
jgi:hypothetical protein